MDERKPLVCKMLEVDNGVNVALLTQEMKTC